MRVYKGERPSRSGPGLKNLPYPERLRRLGLPTLSYRRIRGDMIELYKITTDIYDKESCEFIRLWKDVAPRTGMRGHQKKNFPQQAKTTIRKISFALRNVNIWNSLPQHIVNATSVNSFKNRLDRFWKDQEIVYDNFKAKITTTGSGASTHYNNHQPTESDVEDL